MAAWTMARTAEQIIDVVTPAAGESVTEGTILEWHVKVGDAIEADATIVEISTDKVDVELPSPATGVVTELLVEEGDTVTVGQVIARIAVGASAAAAAEAGGGNGAGGTDSGKNGSSNGAALAEEPAAAAAAPATEQSGTLVDVITPAAGESVTRGHDPRMARAGRRLRSRRATRSSRSPRTRSTSSCPPRRAARSRSCSRRRATR